jgi:hypothetical protein
MKKLNLQEEYKRLGITPKQWTEQERKELENQRDPRSIPLHTKEGKEWLRNWLQENGLNLK